MVTATLDTRPEVIALVGQPYDPSIQVDLDGPPVPCGAQPFCEFPFSSFGDDTAVYASDIGYDSQSGDTPASMPFPARFNIQDGFAFEAAAFEGDRPGGAGRELVGNVSLHNGDGRYDDTALLGWDGRTLEFWRGRKGQAFSAFDILLRGTVAAVTVSESSITLQLRARQEAFEQPINSALYGGTGGLDGHEGIAGLAKPKGFGRCLNVPAVSIDPTNLVYQVHDGRIQQVDAVRDKGVALSAGADFVDYDGLAAATVAGGSYATCLARGLVRLGGTPAGDVTVDFRGAVGPGGYVETTAEIAEMIVGSDVDSSALAALASAQPAPVGYWAGTAQVSIREVLDRLMAGIGGWHSFTREGLFTATRLSVSGSPVETLTQRHVAARAPAEGRAIAPVWRIRVGWGRVWRVQSADALAGTVSDSDRAFYGQETRFAAAQDSTVRSRHRLADTFTVESLFALESDAQAEAMRLLALHGSTDRRIWPFGRLSGIGSHWLGDLVTLDLGRYDQPTNMAVIGLREDFARGETSLVLWG